VKYNAPFSRGWCGTCDTFCEIGCIMGSCASG
jgi:hypothetical protein